MVAEPALAGSGARTEAEISAEPSEGVSLPLCHPCSDAGAGDDELPNR